MTSKSNPQDLGDLQNLLAHADWLRGLATRLVFPDRDASADAVQETWIAALRSPLPGGRAARPWLAAVVRNAVFRAARTAGRRRVRETVAAEATPAEAPSPEQLLETMELQRKLADLVAGLAEPYRTCLLLRYYEGIEPIEIARRLEVPAGTVRWRLNEGLAILRKALAAQYADREGDWRRALLPLVIQERPRLSQGAPVGSAVLSAASIKIALGISVIIVGLVGVVWQLQGRHDRAERAAVISESETPTPGNERKRNTSRWNPRTMALLAAGGPTASKGTLNGVVKDAQGKPVDGALVAVVRQWGRYVMGISGASRDRPIPRQATTAGGGRFTLTDLPPGAYGVTATAPVGSPTRQNQVQIKSDAFTEVTLTLGTGGAWLTGDVQDASGGPVAGAKVVLTSSDLGGVFNYPALFQVATDDKGAFKIRIGAAQYTANVSADGYTPVVDWLEGTVDLERTWRLKPAARLAGRVLDRKTGEPVAKAQVSLRPDRSEGSAGREATSDGDGRFAFDDLEPGGYTVKARADRRVGLGQMVSVGIAQAATGVEVLIDQGRAIRGKVVDASGKGVDKARILVVGVDPRDGYAMDAKSRADGSFVVEGLLPARYEVSALVGNGNSTHTAIAQVLNGDLEGLRLTLTEFRPVHGQVVDSNGAPLADVSVQATVVNSGGRPATYYPIRTDSAGKFEWNRLHQGMLTVTAKHPNYVGAKWGPNDTTAAQASPLVLRMEVGASIAGMVTLEDGRPAPRAQVLVTAGGTVGLSKQSEMITSDEAGRFSANGLKKGSYIIKARRNDLSSPFGKAVSGRAKGQAKVVLEAGEKRTGVVLIVPVGGKRIAGKVLDPKGHPVTGAEVSAAVEWNGIAVQRPTRAGTSSMAVITDGEGNFVLEDLDDQVYSLWAADASHPDAEQTGVRAGTSGITLHMQNGATVAGTVRTRAGSAVAFYRIVALPVPSDEVGKDRLERQIRTRQEWPSVQIHDPSGAFVVGRLGAGSYDLTVTTADGRSGQTLVTVVAGERKQGVQIQIDPDVAVAGRVLEFESGRPLAGVSVSAAGPTKQFSATTAQDGRFRFGAVPVGHWRLDFRGASAEVHVTEHKELDVKAGDGAIDIGLVQMLKVNTAERGFDHFAQERNGLVFRIVDGKPTVTDLRAGFPAANAGLRAGDLILGINGKSVAGLGMGALLYSLGAGNQGEPLRVKIQPRDGSTPREVRLARAPIN